MNKTYKIKLMNKFLSNSKRDFIYLLILTLPIFAVLSILILEEKINIIIVSGAPFTLLYYSTLLKKKFSIKLISDIRDPWTWGSGYGMTLLTKPRKKKEE